MVEQGEDVVGHEAKTSIFRFISLAHLFKAERYHMASNRSDHAFTRMAEQVILTYGGGSMQNVVGIDVSKEKLDICALFDDKVRKKVVRNDEKGVKQLYLWLLKFQVKDPHICMESTGCYSENAAEFLHNLNFKVSVVNPLQVKAFRKSRLIRQKTDSVDAQVIAEFCQKNNPPIWTPRSPYKKELHEINRRVESLKIELHRVTNCLEKKNLPTIVIETIKEEIKYLKKLIAQLEERILQIIEKNPKLKQKFESLIAIKGVGEKTALAILVDMPDIEHFEKSGQFAAFVGITPAHFRSGTSVKGKSKISRVGSKNVRKTLYMSAINVKNYNPNFQNFVQKLQRKGKPPKVIICAVMRKLMCIFFGMLKNSSLFDQNLAFHS